MARPLLPNGVNPLKLHGIPDTRTNRNRVWKAYDWLTMWSMWQAYSGQNVSVDIEDMADFLTDEMGVWTDIAYEIAVAVL